jgi:hypothetical protein
LNPFLIKIAKKTALENILHPIAPFRHAKPAGAIKALSHAAMFGVTGFPPWLGGLTIAPFHRAKPASACVAATGPTSSCHKSQRDSWNLGFSLGRPIIVFLG